MLAHGRGYLVEVAVRASVGRGLNLEGVWALTRVLKVELGGDVFCRVDWIVNLQMLQSDLLAPGLVLGRLDIHLRVLGAFEPALHIL